MGLIDLHTHTYLVVAGYRVRGSSPCCGAERPVHVDAADSVQCDLLTSEVRS
jgi:hypothetical protein